GTHWLNRANQDLAAWFGPAEESLRAALGYYDGAGMRAQAADARYMLALLCANAAARVDAPALVEHALAELAAAEADYDAVRREFSPGGALDAQPGKQALAASSRRIYDLAVQLLLFHRRDVDQAWRWTQRAKARALTDMMGTGSAVPGRVLAALESEPAPLRLARAEESLAQRLSTAPADERPALRKELRALQARVDADPRLREYRELRSGAALEAGDLVSMAAGAAGPATVFVDWMEAGRRLVLLARRAHGPAQAVVLAPGLEKVAAFVAANLAPQSFRDTLGVNFEILDELDSLIQPLAALAAPGERLVLCPTGPLHAVPLHALRIGGEPLLARNPVVYAPSLTVLRHCLARRHPRAGGIRTAALLGDPGGDRDEADALVRDLGPRFGAAPLLRGEVTRAAFAAAVAEADLVHFQGHARHDPADPLASRLELADGVMTARDVFGLPRLRAELVVLAACESAASVVRTGDELLGLIPAFLFAGAQSVLATLWRVVGPSAALVMRHFYDALADGAVDRAEALRRAMLAVRAVPGREAPYHWAPFVLHGAWR
ncbi:MAG TPA: CHAT domain-containing protein, partial [Longimicrobium sp.]|nr:CHAT domain-containing protein [Longimicrobium sp.]